MAAFFHPLVDLYGIWHILPANTAVPINQIVTHGSSAMPVIPRSRIRAGVRLGALTGALEVKNGRNGGVRRAGTLDVITDMLGSAPSDPRIARIRNMVALGTPYADCPVYRAGDRDHELGVLLGLLRCLPRGIGGRLYPGPACIPQMWAEICVPKVFDTPLSTSTSTGAES